MTVLASVSVFFAFSDRMVPLLPEESRTHIMNSVPNKDFEVAYRLDCRNLCADFQEDIEFRFSLGITSLMYRYLGAKGTRQALMGYDAVSTTHSWRSLGLLGKEQFVQQKCAVSVPD